MRPIRLLYVGTFPPPEGGVRVLVRQLAEGLGSDERFEVHSIDMTPPQGRPVPLHLARCIASIARRLPGNDVVMLSGPSNYIERVGPVVSGMAKAAGVPLVVRKFAGFQRFAHREAPSWKRALLEETVFAGAALFVETRADVAWFAEHVAAPVHWLPNHRPIPDVAIPERPSRARRFVYLGALNEGKGVAVLIEAARRLAEAGVDVQVDLYGKDEMGVAELVQDVPNAVFHGLLDHREVYATLAACDVLVLPSFPPRAAGDDSAGPRHREGYPGVLIEAFMVGLPVIASRLEGVAEMTEDGVDALLIEPGDVDELVAAMRRVHEEDGTFPRLCEGAAAARERFAASTWNAAVAARLLEVAGGSA